MKYQYIMSPWPDQEKTWLCADCRKTHSERIMAARWRLVTVSTDNNILCSACDKVEELVNRPVAAFTAIRAFLLTLF